MDIIKKTSLDIKEIERNLKYYESRKNNIIKAQFLSGEHTNLLTNHILEHPDLYLFFLNEEYFFVKSNGEVKISFSKEFDKLGYTNEQRDNIIWNLFSSRLSLNIDSFLKRAVFETYDSYGNAISFLLFEKEIALSNNEAVIRIKRNMELDFLTDLIKSTIEANQKQIKLFFNKYTNTYEI